MAKDQSTARWLARAKAKFGRLVLGLALASVIVGWWSLRPLGLRCSEDIWCSVIQNYRRMGKVTQC